jgi:hypothetical protein
MEMNRIMVLDDCLFPDKVLTDMSGTDYAERILTYLNGKLKKDFLCSFKENYCAGEEGIAYEILCAQIEEAEIKIPKYIFLLLKRECLDWYLDFEYWMQLEPLVIGDIKKCSEIFGKIHFPKTWTENKINQIILSIINDSSLEKIPLTTTGSILNKDGNFSRFAVKGLRNGVMVRVIFEPKKDKVITYYPLYGNGVYCRYLDPVEYYVE